MRQLCISILLILASSLTAFAETYEFRAGPCQSAVRYSHLSGNIQREIVENGSECLRNEIRNRQHFGGRFITGGATSISEYFLNLSDGNYEYVNGRPKPSEIESALRGVAFGLLELGMQQQYKMDDKTTMDNHLTSIRNLIGRQVTSNSGQASAALKFAKAMNERSKNNVQTVVASSANAAISSGERRESLLEKIAALPLPPLDPLKPRPPLPKNGVQVGPILSQITGETLTPDWTLDLPDTSDRMRRLPPSAAKNLALEALSYASEEYAENPELAKSLFEHAQSQRFVAEGRLSVRFAQPSSLVRKYTDFRRKNAVFRSKAAALETLLPSLTQGSPEAERALNSQSASTEFSRLSESLRNDGAFAEAANLIEIGTQILDIGLGFVPIVSTGKDFYELVFGVNPITNEKLDTTDRVLAAVGLISGGVINTKATRAIVKGVKRLGGPNARVAVNTFIDRGDDIVRQAVGIGFKNQKIVKDFFVRPVGKAWGRTRAALTYLDGNTRKTFQAAPPSVEMLPKNRLYARYMKKDYARKFKNGTGPLGPPDDGVTLITSYDDVREFKTHETLRRRLWIRNKADTEFLDTNDWALVRFKMKGSVWDTVSTPTAPNGLENVPGWIPGGRTLGGASEFLISNGTADKLDLIIDRSTIIIDDIVSN